MKKIILLFLLIGTTISYGQTTLANKLKITSNVTSTTATKVNVQEADGIVNTKPLSDFMQLPDIAGKENQFNKQNSLATDGSGVKYPTVDAVNGAVNTINSNVSANTSNISTNTSNISANTTNIATNTTNIATNTSNINLKANLSGATFTGDVQLPSTPVNGTSAVTKGYIDNALTGITWKNAVRVATTANIVLSGVQTVDGIALVVGNRVLVKNQTDATLNGVYLVSDTAWTRSTDVDNTLEIETSTVASTLGTLNKNTQWTCITTNITLGTTLIYYGQISAAGTYTNGTGLSLVGNVFAIDAAYTANTSRTGYLSNTDYTTFNSKQNAIGFTPENVTNKDNGTLTASTTTYPTSGAVKSVTDATTTTIGLKANIASPTFTGVPTAPTATLGTNTTQLATTAFVLANSSSIPQLESNSTDLTVWNNGKGNVATNTSFGDGALKSNTTGFNNTALGQLALSGNTTGNNNIALGAGALANLTNGGQNTALGNDAGSVNGSSVANNSSSNSLFLGRATKPLSSGQNNEIVIGDNATGAGSNTATLGNTSITNTILRGAVTTNGSFINSTAPATNALLANGTTLANPISGTGTNGNLVKFTGAGTVGNSIVKEVGGSVEITNAGGGAPALILKGTGALGSDYQAVNFYGGAGITGSTFFQIGQFNDGRAFIFNQANQPIMFYTNSIERGSFQANGDLKVNNLSGPGVRVVTADASGNLSASIASVDSRPYKVYTALLSQTGTAVPTAVILENTLGGTVVWTRAGTGSYIGTLTGVFTNLKTWTTIGGNYNTPSSFLRLNRSTLDIVSIVTESGGISDNVLENTSIEIRVYN